MTPVQQPPKIQHALALPRRAHVMTAPPRRADLSGRFQRKRLQKAEAPYLLMQPRAALVGKAERRQGRG
jgi:hypothetical protein